MLARTPRADLFASSQEPPSRQSVFREALLCVAIRRRVLVNLLHEGVPVECLFEPTILYLSSRHGLYVSGVAIANADRRFVELEVGKIRRVSITEHPFIVNPVVNRFDAAYARGIICLAAQN